MPFGPTADSYPQIPRRSHILQSKWWIREEKRVYFEVQCRDGALMTLFKRDREWVLTKVL